YCIIRVSEIDERSCPTSPAECQVEPWVSWYCSSSTESVHPSFARWYRVEQPITPPPITTARARPGSTGPITPPPPDSVWSKSLRTAVPMRRDDLVTSTQPGLAPACGTRSVGQRPGPGPASRGSPLRDGRGRQRPISTRATAARRIAPVALDDVLESVPELHGATKVEPLAGGLTNTNYQVT